MGASASTTRPNTISTAMNPSNASAGLSSATAAIIDHCAHVGRLIGHWSLRLTGRTEGVSKPSGPPRHNGGAATQAGSSQARLGADGGDTFERAQCVRRRNHPIPPPAHKVSMGLSATIAFTKNHDSVASAGIPSTVCSPSAPGERVSGDGQQPVP